MAIQAGNILRGEACGCCAHRLPIVIWEAGQPSMHRRAIRCGRVEGGLVRERKARSISPKALAARAKLALRLRALNQKTGKSRLRVARLAR